MCAFTTRVGCNYTAELYAAVRRTSTCLYIPAIYISSAAVALYCCCCCCCSASSAGWQKWLRWFITSDSSIFFLIIHSQCTFKFTYRLAVLSLYSLDFPIIRYHTFSVFTDMCGAKVDVIPSRRSPPCIYYVSPSCWGNTAFHLLSAFRCQAKIKPGFTRPIK